MNDTPKNLYKHLQAIEAAPSNTCEWREAFDGTWNSSCRLNWMLGEGGETPKKHTMNFCPKCGKPLTELTYVWPEEEAGGGMK